ncbi:Helix-turn-helix [Caldanaerovirga acetigignens]|uniref:Helix-turn-helix n=1 Tax=Caldanaerovirga acetigignens TaxID=447595 RepID=A0A1M7LT10_9FIRM|nr:helix-turn-helix transcriptional regulator [Caldanaerovirga acetigignens]SHM81424.1 Helix-turn-helix [Caldanaerovirga acetigignens]
MINSIGKIIESIKGDLSYTELANRIYEKTGYKIHHTTLQKYATGKREPSKKALKILAAYTEKPLSWFLEEAMGTKPDCSAVEGSEFMYEYGDVVKEAKAKNIPPSSLKLFIKAVEEARKRPN